MGLQVGIAFATEDIDLEQPEGPLINSTVGKSRSVAQKSRSPA